MTNSTHRGITSIRQELSKIITNVLEHDLFASEDIHNSREWRGMRIITNPEDTGGRVFQKAIFSLTHSDFRCEDIIAISQLYTGATNDTTLPRHKDLFMELPLFSEAPHNGTSGDITWLCSLAYCHRSQNTRVFVEGSFIPGQVDGSGSMVNTALVNCYKATFSFTSAARVRDRAIPITAATYYPGLLIPSPRHGDATFGSLVRHIVGPTFTHFIGGDNTQGFIDQFGFFYERFSAARLGKFEPAFPHLGLHSEDLY